MKDELLKRNEYFNLKWKICQNLLKFFISVLTALKIRFALIKER